MSYITSLLTLTLISHLLTLTVSPVSYDLSQSLDSSLSGLKIGAISISQNIAVIGVIGEDPETNGSVFLYTFKTQVGWIKQELVPPKSDISYGSCVAINGNFIMTCSTDYLFIFSSDSDNNWIHSQTVIKKYDVSSIKLTSKTAFLMERNSSVIHSFIRNNFNWVELTPISTNMPIDSTSIASYSTDVAISFPESDRVKILKLNFDDNNGATLEQYGSIHPADGGLGDHYGHALDLYNGLLVVAAPNRRSGVVYVYVYNGYEWETIATENSPDSCPYGFGDTIVTYRSYVVVGCSGAPNLYVYYYSEHDLVLEQIWNYVSDDSAYHILTANGNTILYASVSPLDDTLQSLYVGNIFCATGRTGIDCIDINECNDTSRKYCSEICVNYEGGYHCACYDGSSNCLRAPDFPESSKFPTITVVSIALGATVIGFIIFIGVCLGFIKKEPPQNKFTAVPEEIDDDEFSADLDDVALEDQAL